ncbi:hypothetical protein [Kordia sp.]|uniref:hypothetical protein n=1 Tax=Kordia sp. TaxID=1965332 RepID=UPI003D273FBF
MRPELKTIEYIERYLTNTLNDTEKQAFEERMATNPEFRNDVELQQQLIHSLERISLQHTIQNAQQTYYFWKLLKLIGLIGIPIVLILIAWFFLNSSKEVSTVNETIPTKVEQEKAKEHSQIEAKEAEGKIVSISDTIQKEKTEKLIQTKTSLIAEARTLNHYETIPSEIFTIQTERDTIVETQNGSVFLIPKNAFIDSTQKIINGNIQLEIKEALDPMTIMTSGLTTLHNDKPLETGGMFFIEAEKNGEKLQIHPKKEIVVDISTLNYKNEMQLFDGKATIDGIINWTNPKPLKKALIPQDIYSLNFYPPNYLETLSRKGFDSTDKKFTDSLYYSLDFVEKEYIESSTVFSQEFKIDMLKIKNVSKTNGLNPLKVKTIWNERYQNTFIATKAFEERLKMIHSNCYRANYMLDVYLKNLDRDLYVSDSIIAYSAYGKTMNMPFLKFSKQRLTNVANMDTEVSKLNDYYLKQQKVYRLALEKTQQKVDSLVRADKKYKAFSKKQLESYYLNELAITTQKVAKDMQVQLPRVLTSTQRNTVSSKRNDTVSIAKIMKRQQRKQTYRASVRTTGWKNIDRIINEQVIASVKSRTTTTIKNNTKSTTISYSNYEVSIENTETFDDLFVYLVPNGFTSFIRLKAKNNSFTYKLNDLLKYRVYCIAYMNDKPFYFSQSIKSNSDTIELSEITTAKLNTQLSKLSDNNNMLETEVLYQVFRRKNEAIFQNYRKITKLKEELQPIIFPCSEIKTSKIFSEKTPISRDTMSIEFIDGQ